MKVYRNILFQNLCVTILTGGVFGVAHAGGVMQRVPGDPVRLASGLVAGTLVGDGVKAYYGIPFAAPPVRSDRWRAPQPVKPWMGVFTADEKGPSCLQPMRAPTVNHYFGAQVVSENCLYLNVWAPVGAHRGEHLPVVVWVYGGAFEIGSANADIYSGRYLVRNGVIYVAANYRVGILGFFAVPQLARQSRHHASGNYGLLDQIAALKWVQRNISAFGGNPANVTVVGQSAGSMSINALQASPLTHGLFDRAIGISGASVMRGGALGVSSLRAAESQGLHLMHAMHVTSVAQLRGMAPDKLLALAAKFRYRAHMDVDGYVLPQSPYRIFEEGREQRVPILVGSTANDLWTKIPLLRAKDVSQYRKYARQMFGANGAEFLRVWPARTNAEVVRQGRAVSYDSGMGLGALSWATLQAQHGSAPAYLYLFSHTQPYAPGVNFSDYDPATADANHFSDVPYWLGTYPVYNRFRITREWKPIDRQLAREMQDVIVAFAKTGDPSTAEVKFIPFESARPYRTVLGNNIHIEPLNARGIAFLIAHPPASHIPLLRPHKPKQMY